MISFFSVSLLVKKVGYEHFPILKIGMVILICLLHKLRYSAEKQILGFLFF